MLTYEQLRSYLNGMGLYQYEIIEKMFGYLIESPFGDNLYISYNTKHYKETIKLWVHNEKEI